MRLTPPVNLPALGRRQSLYVVCSTWQRPVFLINSRLSHFSAATGSFPGKPVHLQWHSFSRSYGVNLPSSLTRVLSSALGYSPHLPVSVCGTDTFILARRFSWKILRSVREKSLPITPEALALRIYLQQPPKLGPALPTAG